MPSEYSTPNRLADVLNSDSVKLVAETNPSLISNVNSNPLSNAEDQCGVSLSIRSMHKLSADEFCRVLEQSTPEQLQALVNSFEHSPGKANVGSVLERALRVSPGKRSVLSTWLWWESRRPFYNIVVGLSGLPSVIVMSLMGWALPAMMCALVYAVWANICYCLGAPAELVARTLLKDRAEHSAAILLTLGTVFSVLLTVFIQTLFGFLFLLHNIQPRF